MRATRVLVADPLKIFRAGVRNLLRRESEFDVVEAASFADIQRLDGWPELALIDADLPPDGALPIVAWLAERCDCESIVWSFDPERDEVLDAIRAGARGYLHKEISGPGLLRALRGAARGDASFSRDLVTMMVDALHGLEERDRARSRLERLSAREREVLDLIAGGAPTRAIAASLLISEFTVKRHVQNILRKLEVGSRVAAAGFYREAARLGGAVGAEAT